VAQTSQFDVCDRLVSSAFNSELRLGSSLS
jgi:hypothetical protein